MSRNSHRRRTLLNQQHTPADSINLTSNGHSPDFFQRAITVLFHFLVLSVPFFFTWFNEELFEFNKMILTYAITTLIAGAWLMRMILHKRILFRQTWFDLPIGIFLLSQLLATLLSIHPYTSWFGYYTRFHGGLLSTITYLVLFYAFVSNIQKKQVAALLTTLIVGGLGATLYAIPEHFGVSPSCILIEGKATTNCWSESTNPRYRIFGTFGQPNWLAAYAVVLLPVAVSGVLMQLTTTKKQSKWILSTAFTTSIALFASLIFTKSRSGFLGASLAGLLFGIGLGWVSTDQRASTQLKSTLGILAAALLLIVTVYGTPFTPSLQTWFANRTSTSPVVENSEAPSTTVVANRLEVGGTDSGEIRKIVWEGAWKIWQRYPLFGSGVETFAYSYYLDRPMAHNTVSEWDFLYNKAHNEFLNFLATTGAFGLASYSILLTAFILLPLYQWRIKTERQLDQFWLALASAAGLAGLSVSNFFGFSTVMVSILLFLLPAASFVFLTDQQDNPTTKPEASIEFFQLLGFTGVSVLTIWLMLSVNTWWRADNLFAVGKQFVQTGQLTEGAALLKEAAELSPNEALFHDELALTYSQIALALAQQGNATQSAMFKQATEIASDTALALNPVHLNFYKSRARAFITLASIDETYLLKAQESLELAAALAPTDAKVIYNIGLLQLSQGKTNEGVTKLEEAVKMKPNYEAARMSLAMQYAEQGQLTQAIEQYEYILASIAPGNTIAATELATAQASLSAQRRQ